MKRVKINTAHIPQGGGRCDTVRNRKTETCRAGRVKPTGKKQLCMASCSGQGKRPVAYRALDLARGTDPGQS